jgi:hypothetical protein
MTPRACPKPPYKNLAKPLSYIGKFWKYSGLSLITPNYALITPLTKRSSHLTPTGKRWNVRQRTTPAMHTDNLTGDGRCENAARPII